MSRNWRWITRGIVGMAVVAAVDGFLVEPGTLRIRRLTSPLRDLPAEFDGFRIAQISDLHYHGRTSVLDRIPMLLRSEHPDIVVITGDLVDRSSDIEACAEYVGELCRIAAAPVYMVRGNWDHRAFPSPCAMQRWDDTFRQAGAAVLVNENTELRRQGASIWLAGTDDPYFGYADLDATLRSVPDTSTTVVLTHAPEDFIELSARPQVRLVLAGHTHGGQVRLPFVGAVLVPSRYGTRYASGLYRIGQASFYVNAGIGTSHIPVRFLCRPEMTMITLTVETDER